MAKGAHVCPVLILSKPVVLMLHTLPRLHGMVYDLQ